ncbi:MAG TPA: cyanophycin synthetase [Patescibacteria group bacterium]|nr:cyanophycin synthetase [Patescibacteria group bacterium]
MRIHELRIYEGRNIYTHKPCIKADIDLEELADTPTCNIPGFNELLLEHIPSLIEHKCVRGHRGGFVERLNEGTYLAHVLEHMCLELQNLLGYDVVFGKARQVGDEGTIYSVIYEFRSKTVGYEVIHAALHLINEIQKGTRINFNDKLHEIKLKAAKLDLGPSTAAIKKEAESRGIPVIVLGKCSLLQLGYGSHSKKIQATLTEDTSCIAADISCDKELTKDLLKTAGIPIPEGFVSESLEEVLNYARLLGYPVVVKPNNGNQGKGVSVNLKSDHEITAAFSIAKQFGEEIIVEKFIEGKHYRVLVINGEVVACAERIAPFVKGDGKCTIKELIEIENQNPLRGEGHEKALTKIKIDAIMQAILQKNNMDINYVPAVGEQVLLRENDNLSTGGTAIDMTDEIHSENAEIAVHAANIVGLNIAGIDITTKDISIPMREDGGAVIEVNAAPGIRMHYYPAIGKQRNVAKNIVDMLFPEGSKHSIPLISVTGTNGKTTTTRMLSRILQEKGYTVGMTSTGGVYINDNCIMKGDTTGYKSARMILTDKRVDAAVLETARGGIVSRGLGYDLADVGILTNISEDHLGLDGINTFDEMAHVKALVVEAVKDSGYAVLNADDKYCVEVGDRLSKSIIYFSTSFDNIIIQKQIAGGGKAVYIRKKDIYIFDGREEIKLMHTHDIPATLDGAISYNIKNSLSAIAGAFGLGIEYEYIVNALKKFKSDYEHNPGRFNIYEVQGFKVVIDYGHNIDGYREAIASLKNMKHNRLIGVIGVPGDRTETSTVRVGQMCGESFHHIVIKEDKDLRGSDPGVIAKQLLNGCVIGGIDRNNVIVELSEEEALKKAMLMAQPEDIIIIFYEDYNGVVNTINHVNELLAQSQNREILQNA